MQHSQVNGHNFTIRFLPKRTKNTTQERVAFIENWINNYSKKLFNYKTPFEVFSIGQLILTIYIFNFFSIFIN